MITKKNPDLTSFFKLEGGDILMDKPLYWSSFKVIHEIRKHLGVKKIGHAGTLDPRATGLLILCSNRRTKVIDEFQGKTKEYTGTFYLGKTTPSLDSETEVCEERSIDHITNALIKDTTLQFTGEIEQVPSNVFGY